MIWTDDPSVTDVTVFPVFPKISVKSIEKVAAQRFSVPSRVY